MARSSIYPPSITPGIPKLGSKPDGWIETTFGKVLEPVYRKANIQDSHEYQLIVARRNRGGIASRSVLKGREIKTKTQFFIRENDFLIAKRQIIHGACGVVPKELDGAIVSNEYAVLNVRDGLLLEYLNYYCHTVHFQQTCFQSSVGVDVEKMIFKLDQWFKWPLYLPPLPEQRKIAAILSTWDEAIALTERLIAALRERKKGLMQQLLTGKVRFPGFEEQWKEKSLVTLGQCIRGVSYKPKLDLYLNDNSQSVRLLRANNIRDGRVNLDRLQYVDRAKVNDAQYLRPGDTTICISSGSQELVGKTAPFDLDGDTKYTVGAFCAIYRARSEVDQRFINQLLRSPSYRRKLHTITAGTNIKNLRPSDFEKIKFFFPPTSDEMNKISQVLEFCDAEIELHERKLAALRQQKKGLMQRLLTGQVRVKVD